MLYTEMERRYEDDGEARAAARAAAEEDLLLNHTPDVRELPTVLEADLDASHDAGVLSVQCCPGEDAVITGSGMLRSANTRYAAQCCCQLSAILGPQTCVTLTWVAGNSVVQRVDFEDNIVWRTSLKSGGIVSLALQPASGSVLLCAGAAPPRRHALMKFTSHAPTR